MAKKITPQALTGLTNVQFWDEARKNNPQFESYTSAGTKSLFTESGFEALKRDNVDALNKFFELSLRIAFQKVDVAFAKNPLENAGLLEEYNTPNGGYIQRIAVESIDPISPAYDDLQDGDSIDPFVVRKPKSHERFFRQNYSYQSMITIQDNQAKQIFLSEDGMGQYLAGILQGLESGRVKQEYANTLEALNAYINSTDHPLKDTQKVHVDLPDDADAVTEEQLRKLVEALMDVGSALTETSVSTGEYNAMGFDTYVDPSRYTILIRAPYFNRIKTRLRVGAYNPGDLALPFDIHPVADFGGNYPYADEGFETRVYPIYTSLGAASGYFITEENGDADSTLKKKVAHTSDGDVIMGYQTSGKDSAIPTIENAIAKKAVYYKDENSELKVAIAQRGIVFKNWQNGYSVQPIYNPRGIYQNYWANEPWNGINTDYAYNFIGFINGQA